MKKTTLLGIVILLCFLLGVSRLEDGRKAQGKQQLEDALRRRVVSCYALEGFYPQNVEYLTEHYGLQYDQDAYTIRYEYIASNLMPEITVLEVQ